MPKNTDPLNPPKSQRQPLRQVVPKLLLSTAYFWVPVLIFLRLANEVHEKEPLLGDTAILQWFRQFSTPGLDAVVVAITQFGSAPAVAVGLTLSLAALVWAGHRRDALFLLFCAGGTALINLFIKVIFERDRPSLWQHIVTENSYSFPSGHAMISSALALSFILIFWHTRYRWIVVGFGAAYCLLVSTSRLYLGVHFPSDVLAGWCVSLLWVLTVHHVFKRFGRKNLPNSNVSK